MIKLIYSDQLPNDLDRRMTMIEDPEKFAKKASVSFDFPSEALRPPKGYVGIHTVALGDWEHYGMNRNGDAFTKDACQKYHHTFVKHGHVFRNHDNKDPKNAIGKIAASVYNEPMGRIELVIWADEKKAAPELHKLAKEGTHSFSMACTVPNDRCFTKGTLVLTSAGFKPIETISVGDMVVGSDARLHRVSATMVNESRSLSRVKLRGMPEEIECTQNHPFEIVPFEQIVACHGTVNGIKRRHTFDDSGVCMSCHRPVNLDPKWKQAKDLVNRDYVRVKTDSSNPSVTRGVAFAYLCGMYLGDGSASFHQSGHAHSGDRYCLDGLSISASGKESDNGIIVRICDMFRRCTGKTATVVQECNGKNAFVVHLHDYLLASRILNLVGSYSHSKHIDQEILNWSVDEKLAFLSGYLDADGHLDSRNGTVKCRISSINKGLLLSVQRILWSVGTPASVYIGNSIESRSRGKDKPDGGFYSDRCCYSMFFTVPDGVFAPYSAKIACFSTDVSVRQKDGGTSILLSGGYAYIPVQHVHSFDCDAVATYNLEVEDCHTYIAEGATVHNCLVCGTIRKNAMDPNMCDHIRYDLGKIAADGTAIGTFNDEPTWFDESFVNRPADRIAWDLGKVASVGAGGEPSSLEYAEMAHIHVPDSVYELESPGYGRKTALFRKLAAYERAYFECAANGIKTARDLSFVNLAKAASTDVSPDFLQTLRSLPCTDFLKAASDLGVVFSAPVFFKYAFGRDFGAVADKMPDVLNIAKNGLFSQLEKKGMLRETCSDAYFGVSGVKAQPLPYDVGEQLKKAFSVLEPYASRRALAHVASGYPLGTISQVKFASEESPEAVKLAAAYAAYVLETLDNLVGKGIPGDDRILALSAAQNLVL